MKKIIALVLSLCFIFGFSAIGPLSTGVSAAGPAVNSQDVKIYALSEWAQDYISLPSGYATEFQLTVSGASNVYFRVTEGYTVEVSSSGLITPSYLTYWDGSKSVNFGRSVITVTADGVKLTVNVEVINYANVYADKVLDDFIASNVTADMTGYEKICLAAKFAADHEYSAGYSSCAGMVITGGGDCWASTDTIIQICTKLGIEAWARNGNRDYGAGSGHMNAMAYADGKYYEAEAGYYEPAPRYYSVTERKSLFSYRYDYTYGGLEVYQYDAKEMPEKLIVPEQIDGVPVVSIGNNFVISVGGLKEVVLPDTVKHIGDSAFNSCADLQTVNIPSSLVDLGEFVFTNCKNLKELTGGNDIFVWENGGLVKNGRTLLYVPNADSYVIKDTVTEIAPYAFYYNSNIKTVTVPPSVTAIGEGAFGNCTALQSVDIKGDSLRVLDSFAFTYASSLGAVYVPDSVTEIGENLSYGLGPNFMILCRQGSDIAQYAEEHEIPYSFVPDDYEDFVKGDINDDGEVNNKDVVILFRLMSGEDVKVNTYALDPNGDGFVDNKDVVQLFRYCSGENVTISGVPYLAEQ